MWTKVENVEITDDQQKAFEEAAIKKEALRRMFDNAMDSYVSGLEEVGTAERELWNQIRDANGFDFGDREYRLIPSTKTLQSRPNRHGNGNMRLPDDKS